MNRPNLNKPANKLIDVSESSSIGSAHDLIAKAFPPHGIIKSRERASSVDSDKSRKSVRFRDGLNGGESESKTNCGDTITIEDSVSVDSIDNRLVDIASFGTLMQQKEPWGDYNFLAGFREIFAAGEVEIKDTSCLPFGWNSSHDITDGDEKRLYYAIKHQQMISTWLKSTIFHPFSSFRNGFKIRIFNRESTLLVTFVRKTHYHATQLDIVETFYGKELVYVGRIERSSHGYTLKDKDHTDIYRVLELPKSRQGFGKMSRTSIELTQGTVSPKEKTKLCSCVQKEMKIFRTDTKEVVGRVIYLNRGAGIRLFSGCLYQPYAAFKCTPDMGTNAKVLLIGTLFFLLHSKHDKFVDLPLGLDAKGFEDAQTNNSDSLASLDRFMKH